MTGASYGKYALLLTTFLVAGCAGMAEGPPPISASKAPELQRITAAIQNICLNLPSFEEFPRPEGTDANDQAAQPVTPADPETERLKRNELVSAFVTAADIGYNQYERDLLAFVRQNELGASLSTQLLAAIGAASGSEDLTRATTITQGVVAGTQSAFAKSLLNQTVNVLQTHMRASRAKQYAVLIERRTLPYDQWDYCMALSDAMAYEQAGTLNAALAAMSAAATDDERAGQSEAQQALRVSFNRGPTATALRDYLTSPNKAVETQRKALAVSALTNLTATGRIPAPAPPMTVEARLGLLSLGGETEDVRRALITQIIAGEPDAVAKATLQQAVK